MKNITEYLREKYAPWGWMGQRAHDALGINALLPLDFIISCDYGIELKHYFREEDVFSVEKQCKIRQDWSNEHLKQSFSNNLGKDILKRWNSYKKRVNLLCYRSIDVLEGNVDELDIPPRIYGVPERLKTFFDNKNLLYQKLPELSLPRIPGKIIVPEKFNFNYLRSELSLPFVVQFPYGSSGHFTFIIRNEREYLDIQKKYPDSLAVIRRYIDGFSLNVNAVIISTEKGSKTVCSFPSVQITGVPECSNFSSAFCGNDFSAAKTLNKSISEKIKFQTEIIGKWMVNLGYRGIFGIDFVAKDETVYPVEINPRFQNSTSLFTALNAGKNDNDDHLFLLHIAEFLQKEDVYMRKYIENFEFEKLMNPLDGAQIILHNRMDRTIVGREVVPGAYFFGEKGLCLITEGVSFSAGQKKEEIILTSGVPGKGIGLEPNASICKIQVQTSVLNPDDKKNLSDEMKEIVLDVYGMFELSPSA
ncbi:MAG: ATP-grasp domain-containing protein [Candidatus Omnitrophota bacterium]